MKRNIVLCGMPSSGKSTVGYMLSERLNLDFIDTDSTIVESEGRSIPDIFAKDGETVFRAIESKVIESVAKRDGVVIALGGGAVLNPSNVSVLKQNGTIIFLDRKPEFLTPTPDRPLSNNTEALRAMYEKRLPVYHDAADYVIDNNGTPQDAVNKIYELL